MQAISWVQPNRGSIYAVVLSNTIIFSGAACLAQSADSPSAQTPTAPMYVMRWDPTVHGCDEKFLNGIETKSMWTTQASIIVQLFPDVDTGKLTMHVLIANPDKSKMRLEVIPENIHLLKIGTGNASSEVRRNEATKLAKGMERRQRIAAGLSGFGAGVSSSTATVTSSDGSTSTVRMPNDAAVTSAQAHGAQGIAAAQRLGAELEKEEVKRNSLEPGEETIGNLWFDQKSSAQLLVQIELANVRYEIPFNYKKK